MSDTIEVVYAEERIQVVESDSNLYITLDTSSMSVLPSTTETLDAEDAISGGYNLVFVAGNGTHVTLTSTPSIAAGTTGQMLVLLGTNDSATVTLQDNSVLDGSTLHLHHAQNHTLGLNDSISFIYSGTAWIQMAPLSDSA